MRHVGSHSRVTNARQCEFVTTLFEIRDSLRRTIDLGDHGGCVLGPSLAQAPTIVRTVLAVASLPSVVDAPLFFKLSKVELAPGQTTTYFGPVGFLYVLSGSLTAQTSAGQWSLQQDDALLVLADNVFSLRTSGTESALFLHYVLGRSTWLDRAAEQPPAVVTELYRTP